MSKHSKNNNTSGRTVFLVLLAFAFAAAVWSLVTGNSDLSRAEEISGGQTAGTSTAQSGVFAAEKTAGEAAGETAGGATGETTGEERMSFGQIPQSTDNAQAEEALLAETAVASAADAGGVMTDHSTGQTAGDGVQTSDASLSAGSGLSAAAGSATVSGSATSSGSAAADPSSEELLLVNKTHPLAADYWPDDLVTVSSCVEGVGNSDTKKMRKVAAEALEKLIAGAAAEGYQIKMRTGFRSYDYQKTLFASYAQNHGEEEANKFSARAGESEHQSGLCCDVSSPSVNWAISYEYDDTPEGKWLEEHGHEYGFIIRYLPGKEAITGYNAEPWHIRYVGIAAATEIYEKGICFEEYLGITD